MKKLIIISILLVGLVGCTSVTTSEKTAYTISRRILNNNNTFTYTIYDTSGMAIFITTGDVKYEIGDKVKITISKAEKVE